MNSTSSMTVYPQGVKVRITPDEELQPWPDHLPVPTFGVFEWVKDRETGAYTPMIRKHSAMIRLTRTIAEDMGLGISSRGLERLIKAGFVRSEKLTPGCVAFDLQSLLQHRAKVAADPEFWSGKNLREYMSAI